MVSCTVQFLDSGGIYYHHNENAIEFVIGKEIRQHAAVRLIHVAHRSIRIHEPDHLRIPSLIITAFED